MARLGTALDRRPAAEEAVGRLGRRWAAAVERREAGAVGDSDRSRRDPRRPASPMGDRLATLLERGLARAVERRLGVKAAGGRQPGAMEQRLVAALVRRFPSSRGPAAPAGGALARAGRSLQARRSGGLPAAQQTTIRALVIGLLARGLVRTLTRLVRIFARGLVSAPMRRIASLLARRAVRARPSNQAGLLALLLGAIALAWRILSRRVAAMSASRRTAIMVVLRILRVLLPWLERAGLRLGRALAALAARELRRLVAAAASRRRATRT